MRRNTGDSRGLTNQGETFFEKRPVLVSWIQQARLFELAFEYCQVLNQYFFMILFNASLDFGGPISFFSDVPIGKCSLAVHYPEARASSSPSA